MNIALFASGNGSNVQAIIDRVEAGELDVNLAALVCDRPKAKVIERAEQANIPALVASPKHFETREDWELHVIDFLHDQQVDFIVLAGFMRLLKAPLLREFPNRIINIHPSYLPDFPGMNSIQDAYDAKVAETGVTVFYVDEGIDTGKIIAQERIEINPEWSLETLETAVHEVEHRLYPAVIQNIQQSYNERKK